MATLAMTLTRMFRPRFNWPLALWTLCALVAAVVYLALVPIHIRTNMQDEMVWQAYQAVRPALSMRTFGYLLVAGRYAGLLTFLAVAALIVWRRPRDHMALIVATMLLTLPLAFGLAGYSDTWLPYPPPL